MVYRVQGLLCLSNTWPHKNQCRWLLSQSCPAVLWLLNPGRLQCAASDTQNYDWTKHTCLSQVKTHLIRGAKSSRNESCSAGLSLEVKYYKVAKILGKGLVLISELPDFIHNDLFSKVLPSDAKATGVHRTHTLRGAPMLCKPPSCSDSAHTQGIKWTQPIRLEWKLKVFSVYNNHNSFSGP